MAWRSRAGAVHAVFELAVVLKGIDAVLEVIGAVLLLLVSPRQIGRAVALLTQHELSQDPHDLVAGLLVHAAGHLSVGGTRFASAYLLSHGALKLLLVWALLTSRLWAYPVAIAVFAAFCGYQVYRFALTGSLAMAALTILDLFVIAFTWLEWRRVRRDRDARARSAGAAGARGR